MRLNILPLLSLCLLLGPTAAIAQNHANDYRIEVLVFERQYRNDSPLDEKWPRNISLSYPETTQYLYDSDQSDGSTVANESDHFQFLPGPELKLDRHRRAVEKDYRLRTLFHKAWKQPLGPTQSAPALIIRGGDAYGEHYELEGFITLGVSRYVHVDTDLWLSEFLPNHGEEPEYWMALPSLPGMNDGRSPTSGGLILDDTPDEFGEPVSEAGVESIPDSLAGYPTEPTGFTDMQSVQYDEQAGLEHEVMDPMEQLRNAPFHIKDIVTVRQSRRMRTNELHYIDHPRIGILIQVEPLR